MPRHAPVTIIATSGDKSSELRVRRSTMAVRASQPSSLPTHQEAPKGRMTFEELTERARAGDGTAYAQIWQKFNPSLMRYLGVMAGRDAADDLASTTWLEVVRGLGRFQGDEAHFRAWVFTIARHRFLDQRRMERRRPSTVGDLEIDISGDVEATHRAFDTAEGTRRALALISKLSPDQAEAVMLRVVADLDVESVARIMRKRPGTVRVLAHRGIRRLAELLPDETEL
jgi:RNA polymerase sigma-70 factor (ECF subfamily)